MPPYFSQLRAYGWGGRLDGLSQDNLGFYQTAIPAIGAALYDFAFGERTLQPLNSNSNYRQRAVRPVLDE